MKLVSHLVSLELLTPCWAGGADPATQADVRVATIRGQLRWWLCGLYPDDNADIRIFGAAAEGGMRASRVTLRLDKMEARVESQDLEAYMRMRTDQASKRESESYFLWPLRTQKRGALYPPKCESHASFSFSWSWLPFHAEQRELGLKIERAVRAFSLLGTRGTRATRGYGSVWNPEDKFNAPGELIAALSFLPPTVQVRLLPSVSDIGLQALAEAALWMRNLRIGTATYGERTEWGRNDHDVADPLQPEKRNAVVHRQALGMPLAQRFRRGNATTVVSSKYSSSDPMGGRGLMTDRYPSPVRIKVCRLAGKYRVLVVILRGLLLPENTKIRLSSKGGYAREALLSHDLVEHIATQGEAAH